MDSIKYHERCKSTCKSSKESGGTLSQGAAAFLTNCPMQVRYAVYRVSLSRAVSHFRLFPECPIPRTQGSRRFCPGGRGSHVPPTRDTCLRWLRDGCPSRGRGLPVSSAIRQGAQTVKPELQPQFHQLLGPYLVQMALFSLLFVTFFIYDFAVFIV